MTELSTIPISRLNNTELDTKIKTEIDKNGIDLSTITTNCITEIPQDIKLELNGTTWHAWEQSRTFTIIYTKSAAPQINDKVYIDGEEVGYVSQVSGTTIYAHATKDADGGFPMGSELDFARMSGYDYTGSILILKAGSKLYVPNGFEEDGTTQKFDIVTIASDIKAGTPYTNAPIFIYYYNNGIGQANSSAQCSGASNTITNGFWYDTTNNGIKRINDSVAAYSGISFPIAIVSASSGSWASIDKVFNGFGYIGSTQFVLPGIKGLIPNGRNEDGSLKNIEVVSEKVIAYTRTINGGPFVLGFARGATNNGYQGYIASEVQPTSGYVLWYKPSDNFIYRIEQGVLTGIYDKCIYGTEIRNTSSPYNITSFQSKTAFHALDYNDKSTIVGWGIPDYTSVINITSPYTVPTDGMIELFQRGVQTYDGSISVTINGIAMPAPFAYITSSVNKQYYVSKGDVVVFSYGGGNSSTRSSKFYPLKGVNNA